MTMYTKVTDDRILEAVREAVIYVNAHGGVFDGKERFKISNKYAVYLGADGKSVIRDTHTIYGEEKEYECSVRIYGYGYIYQAHVLNFKGYLT